MSHQHPPAAELSERSLDLRLGLTAGLNVAITVAEFVGGLHSSSLALLSDAAHNLGEWGITQATLEPELESCGHSELLGRWEAS